MSEREDVARERVEKELTWWLSHLHGYVGWRAADITSPVGYTVAAILAAASLREMEE